MFSAKDAHEQVNMTRIHLNKIFRYDSILLHTNTAINPGHNTQILTQCSDVSKLEKLPLSFLV